MTSSLPLKSIFLGILSKFFQISAFYTTKTRKLPHRIMVEIIHNTPDIFLNQIFPKIFQNFGPMMSSFSQNLLKFAKKVLFGSENGWFLGFRAKIVQDFGKLYYKKIP